LDGFKSEAQYGYKTFQSYSNSHQNVKYIHMIYFTNRFSMIAFFMSIVVAITTIAVESQTDATRLNAIKALKIEHGQITYAGYETTPTMVLSKGRELSNLPPRTIVKIVLNPAEGSNINVQMWLPVAEKWNGRFLGLGNGGAAGNINPGIFAGPLKESFAVATTDMGTAPNARSGIGNPEVWKDFGYRATHLMTAVGKQITQAYYGKSPDRSYFVGNSTGGQQALQEAQRYPDDYNGIIANIPAHCRTPLHAYFLWNDQILRSCSFTASQKQNVTKAGNEYMASREIPQTAGKMVSDPRCTGKDIQAVIQLARQKDLTLTDAHAAALEKLFDGPRHATTGERIFCGIPFGASFDIAHGHLYLFNWVFGADMDLMTINWDKDIDTYTAALGPYLNAENADLSQFNACGGKLIMISGSADSCVPYHASLDYYERVVEQCGSLAKAQSFIRLYMVPGMSHGPGPGINRLPSMLNLVMNWFEKGIAPDRIEAKRVIDGHVELNLPLFPYPAKTIYSEAKGFERIDGPRGGVDRIASRFRPPPE
jgi:feruloyl esterase